MIALLYFFQFPSFDSFNTFAGTAVGTIIGFILKSFWDRYWKSKDDLILLKRNKILESTEKQLSEFYWPLYLRLQKDNAVWSKILDRSNQEEVLKQKIAFEVEKNFILPNHDEIVNLIETKIHFANVDEELLKELLAYIRHIAVYKGLRTAGETVDPISLGEPWPKQLFPLIEAKVKALQNTHELLLEGKSDQTSEVIKSLPA